MSATAMWREIAETPAAVERSIRDGRPAAAAVGAAIRAYDPAWVTLVARGSSDFAATYGRYLVEVATGLPTGLAAASVTTVYGAPRRWGRGLVIAISQSGRSPDLVAVVEAARAGGALTVCVTNDVASPLAEASEHVLDCRAGPERAVAATKSYVACLVTVASLVDAWASVPPIRDGLNALPAALSSTVASAAQWLERSALVREIAHSSGALVVSRGYDLATALETAIKIQETAGVLAVGMSTADLEHGPIALAGPGTPVVAFRPDGPAGRRIDGALERVRAAGGRPWVIGGQEAPTRPVATDGDARSLRLPLRLPEELLPTALVIPGHLLAEAVARERGRDPDRPAGLTKVTLTT